MSVEVKFYVQGKRTNRLIMKMGDDTKREIKEFIDSEVLRICDPYIPFESGQLKASGQENTIIGSGKVVWDTPYARYLYHGKLMVDPDTGSSWAKAGGRKVLTQTDLNYQGGPTRGAYWFDRAMQNGGQKEIERGIRQLCRRKSWLWKLFHGR